MLATIASRAADAPPSDTGSPAAAPAPVGVARTQPLRVLTFLNSLAPGGVERVALRLHAAWTAAGVETRLVLADGTIPPGTQLANVELLGHPHSAIGRFFVLLIALPRLIARHRPDVLFCAGNTYAGPAVAMKLLLGKACPIVVAKISNDLVRADMRPLARWWYRRWLKLQGRHIDHFVGMAPAMRAEIAALIGVTADRISIIEDPALSRADIARLSGARSAAVQARSGRHFLAVGRLVPQKNFALLLDAFAAMARGDDRLTILGEGAERTSLEAQAARLGLADRVALPGHVEPLDAWLGAADAFVLSSDYEGVPAVVIEALAAGLPIAATDCCVSMRDLLGHGALGRIVPVGDVPALAAAMDAILADPSAPTAQRAEAARFTIEHATGKYDTLMRMLAADPQPPPINAGRSPGNAR